MNKVVILGTITRDPEIKYSQSGSAILNFGIATNDRWKDASGQVQEKAHFFDITAFGKQAETINQYFHKGSRILAEGSLDYQSWVAQDGSKKSKVGIKLQSFTFVDRKSDGQQQCNNQQYQQQGQPAPQQQQAPQQNNQGGYQQQNNQGGYQAPQQQNNQQYQHTQQGQQAKPLPQVDIDTSEIPF